MFKRYQMLKKPRPYSHTRKMRVTSLIESVIYGGCLLLVCGLTFVDGRITDNTIDYCPTLCGESILELNLRCLVPRLATGVSIREFCDTVVLGADLSRLGDAYICTWTLSQQEASGGTSRCMGSGGLTNGR